MGDDTDAKVLARMGDDVRTFAAMRQAKGKSRIVDSQIASTLWQYWGCERFDWFVAEMVEVLAAKDDIGSRVALASPGGKGGIGSTGGTGGIGSTGGKGSMGSKGDDHGTKLADAVLNLVQVMDWEPQQQAASSSSKGEGKGIDWQGVGWHTDEKTGLKYKVSGAPGKLLLETLQKIAMEGEEAAPKKRRVDETDL